jgi:hypothetical protein
LGSFSLSEKERSGFLHLVNGKKRWVKAYLKNENIEEADRISDFKIYPNAKATYLKDKLEYLKQRKLNLYHE